MTVKHIPTGIVHRGNKGGNTACGSDTNDAPAHWQACSQPITCQKKGCKK